MDIGKYIERTKAMYNDCARSFSQYLKDNDMDAYNRRNVEIRDAYMHADRDAYERKDDVIDLLLWFALKAQTIQDIRLKEEKRGERRNVV